MGEGGEIFLLDMGKPVKIDELARQLITLSGFVPNGDIQVVYTGVRPGEKLHEELLTDGEIRVATRHDRIFVAPVVRAVWSILDQAGERFVSGIGSLSGPMEAFEELLAPYPHGQSQPG